jgi:hypothetical protein
LKYEGKVANTSKLLDTYYENYFETRRWKEVIGPKAKLRAKMWDTCPLYVGLFREMHEMPRCGNGIILIGDAAGFQGTAGGAGIANAWFSADLAADVAIEAIKAGDTSAAFLRRYDELWKAYPEILPSITDWGRWNLVKARQDASLMVRLTWEHLFSPVINFVPHIAELKPGDLAALLPKV